MKNNHAALTTKLSTYKEYLLNVRGQVRTTSMLISVSLNVLLERTYNIASNESPEFYPDGHVTSARDVAASTIDECIAIGEPARTYVRVQTHWSVPVILLEACPRRHYDAIRNYGV